MLLARVFSKGIVEEIDREESVVEWRVSEWQGGILGRISTLSL